MTPSFTCIIPFVELESRSPCLQPVVLVVACSTLGCCLSVNKSPRSQMVCCEAALLAQHFASASRYSVLAGDENSLRGSPKGIGSRRRGLRHHDITIRTPLPWFMQTAELPETCRTRKPSLPSIPAPPTREKSCALSVRGENSRSPAGRDQARNSFSLQSLMSLLRPDVPLTTTSAFLPQPAHQRCGPNYSSMRCLNVLVDITGPQESLGIIELGLSTRPCRTFPRSCL